MPLSTPSIREQSEYYDERWTGISQQPITGLRLQRATEIMSEIASLGLNAPEIKVPEILDFGCGTGKFTSMLSHLGDVTGVELSEKAVELAKTRHPDVRFYSGNAFETDLNGKQFDVVVLQEVIEHVEDQRDLIRRCFRLTKPGGSLILTTPNKAIVHQSGVHEKAKQAGTLQPIENILTVREARNLVASFYDVTQCRTVIPAGMRGWLRVVNSPRLCKWQWWDAMRSCLPVGLHTIIVGTRPSQLENEDD